VRPYSGGWSVESKTAGQSRRRCCDRGRAVLGASQKRPVWSGIYGVLCGVALTRGAGPSSLTGILRQPSRPWRRCTPHSNSARGHRGPFLR
jgi:hypothetical protein